MPAAPNPRYDRAPLLRALRACDAHALSVIPVHLANVSDADRQSRQAALANLVAACCHGLQPELGPLSEGAVTADTPPADLSRRLRDRVLQVAGKPGVRLGAAQVVIGEDGELKPVRRNRGIQGVLWHAGGPDWFRVGFELAGEEWRRLSHITVFNGRVHGKSASLCFFNVRPLFVYQGDAQQIARLARHSIGVSGARQRWDAWRQDADGDEVRSALWEALEEGIHSRRLGTFILDRVDDTGSRTSRAERSRQVATPADSLLRDHASDFDQDPAVQIIERLDAVDALDAVMRLADPDERRLLEALLADPHLRRTEVYRRNGWESAAGEAVFKRLQRRARKNSNSSMHFG